MLARSLLLLLIVLTDMCPIQQFPKLVWAAPLDQVDLLLVPLVATTFYTLYIL